jgi:hypothetical protein
MVVSNLYRRVCKMGVALLAVLLSCGTWGCSSHYVTPGRAADFKALGLTREQLTDAGIRETLDKPPLAKFPCAIAAARIQAPGYRSETAQSYGTGNYTIITTRDIEGDRFAKLAELPMISSVAPLNRLVLPQTLNSDMELRQAAASLHADMLLIYTVDTTYNVNDEAEALTVLTLGVSPNQVVHIVSTASAVLLDTRNGYIYGYAEGTKRIDQLANGWGASATVDDARRRAESQAFGRLVDQVSAEWPGIVHAYSPNASAPPASAAAGANVRRVSTAAH